MTKFLKTALIGALLTVSAVSLASGCSSDEARGGTVSGCTLNTDCSSNLVCTFGRCHVECRGTKDCPPGLRCVSTNDANVCQLAEERECGSLMTSVSSFDGTCPAPLKCASDGQCRNECTTGADCLSGQVCAVGGRCAEPREVDSFGRLKTGADGGTPDASATGGAPGNGGAAGGGAGGTTGSGGTDASVSNGGKLGTGGAPAGGGSGGRSSTGGAGGSDASIGTPDASTGGSGNTDECPTERPGRKMVKVSAPGPSGSTKYYCIDSTEVTACDYEAFLASSPSTQQIAQCAWNTDYRPDQTNYCYRAYDPANHPNIPMRCIDWCDAVAYCSWAGKELCGAIDGGPRGFLDLASSAWGNACSGSGRRTYPYGNTLDASACVVGPDAPPAGVKDVASTPTCEGGVPGLFDMGGNVAEWENACDGNSGAATLCEIRGGSFAQDPNAAGCNEIYSSSGATRRDLRGDYIGFRCCSRTVKPGADAGRDPSKPVPGAFCPGASAEPQGRDGGPLKPRGCPTPAHGSNLVEVPAPPGSPVESYCMDAKEATYADYTAFLASGYPTSGQQAVCSWNGTYVPECNWPGQIGQEQLPVGCVDWCDAAAFCAWSGKRLCGRVGGGAAPFIQTVDPPRELVNACTKGGTRAYPYGDVYDPLACNGNDFNGQTGYQSGADLPKPVGTIGTCAGPYTGLFDLVGNVAEWENSCQDTSAVTDGCLIRGGGFQDNAAIIKCGAFGFTGRNNHVWDIGIRCCTDSL